jgi:hypothetical protein
MRIVEAPHEPLPPLDLRRLRDLDLSEPPEEGRPAHIASASGIAKRVFLQVGGFNLGLVMRRLVGAGRPRAAWALRALAHEIALALRAVVCTILTGHASTRSSLVIHPLIAPTPWILASRDQNRTFATAC